MYRIPWPGFSAFVAGPIVGSSIPDEASRKKAPPGDVRGFDVRTGKTLWVFESVPQKSQLGNETWEDNSWEYTGNANV